MALIFGIVGSLGGLLLFQVLIGERLGTDIRNRAIISHVGAGLGAALLIVLLGR